VATFWHVSWTFWTIPCCWPQVVHCLALAADMSGDSAAAIRWLEVLTSLVPHDPGVLCKLGAIYHRCDAMGVVVGHSPCANLMLAQQCSTSAWSDLCSVEGVDPLSVWTPYPNHFSNIPQFNDR
jgi:hypothetical protein